MSEQLIQRMKPAVKKRRFGFSYRVDRKGDRKVFLRAFPTPPVPLVMRILLPFKPINEPSQHERWGGATSDGAIVTTSRTADPTTAALAGVVSNG